MLMAVADTYELTIDQARDWEWSVRWKVGRNERTAVPKPGIETFTFFMGFKAEYEDPACIVLLTNGPNIVVTPDGWIRLWMPHTLCELLPVRRIKWELMCITPENRKIPVGKGLAIVVPKVV